MCKIGSHPFSYSPPLASVIVKCAQTSKMHCVKLKDLSREDCRSLTKKDLRKGASLIVEMKGKCYPVQFVHFKDKNSSSDKRKVVKSSHENGERKSVVERKRQLQLDEDAGQLRDKTNVADVLAKAKSSKVSMLLS